MNICGKVFSKSWTQLKMPKKTQECYNKKIFFHNKSVSDTIDRTLSHDDGQRIYRRTVNNEVGQTDKKAILSQHYKLARQIKISLTVLAHAVVQQDYKLKIYPKEPSQFRDLIFKCHEIWPSTITSIHFILFVPKCI